MAISPTIKFYVRLHSKTNQVISLFYVDYSDYSEKRFDESTQAWVPIQKIYLALTSGSLDYDEISEKTAQRLYPEAFNGDELAAEGA